MAARGRKTFFMKRGVPVAFACLCLGAVLFSARPVCAAGSANLAISITITAPPPAASVSYPSEGLSLATDTFDVTGSASASNGTVSAVQVRIDGGAWMSAVSTGANYSTWKYAVVSLSSGSHSVECRATDQYGGQNAPSPPVTFTVSSGDTTPPTAPGTVNDGQGTDIAYSSSTTRMYANWSASSDGESGITRYWYAIGSGAGATDVLDWTDAGAAVSATQTGLNLSDGTKYYVSVRAENGAGLLSQTASSNGWTVDVSPPVSSITTPADGAYLKQLNAITGTAADAAGSGPAKVEVSILRPVDGMYWGGTEWQAVVKWLAVTSGTASWTLSLPAPPWENGKQYALKSRASDQAGNVETPGTGSAFFYDTQPPALAITSPAAGYISGRSPVTISGTAENGAAVHVNSVEAVMESGGFTAQVILVEGANTITATAQDAVGNSATASITVILDTIAPAAAITAPAIGQYVSGTVTVAGTAEDANFLEYALYYAPGESPSVADWKPVAATGTASVASGTLGVWDTSRLGGSYTLMLAVRDKAGHSAQASRTVSIGNSFTITGVLPLNQWTMIAMPGIPRNPEPRSFLGDSGYLIQRWDPTLPSEDPWMFKYVQNFAVTAGDAFWVKPYTEQISYSAAAWVTDTSESFGKRLEAGWNQVGAPYERTFNWSAFRFRRDGDAADVPLKTAIDNGWINSSFYSYGSSGYAAHDVESALAPHTGYFVKANAAGELLLDPEADIPAAAARIVKPSYEWRLQLAAVSGDEKDTDNFAGEMRGASDSFLTEDSEEPPTVEPYVSVYFTRAPESGGPLARYASDIRAPQKTEDRETGKSWSFVVKTDTPGKQVTLNWPDAASIPGNYELRIRDDFSGAEIDPREQGKYSFTTGVAGDRSFTLIARRTGEPEPVALKTTVPAGWSLFSVPLEPAASETDVRVQLGRELGGLAVYQHYGGRLFDPESPERVDIQAGIGYWVYAEKPTVAEFRGSIVTPGTPVDVPLLNGWNFIGDPFSSELRFGDNITYICHGEAVVLSEAAARGWVGNRLYRFNNVENKFQPLEFNDFLVPWEGYVFRAYEPCVLQLK